MADYKVDSYTSSTKDNGNGYRNIYIKCGLINTGGNSSVREYRVASDVNYDDLDFLKNILDYGFVHAMQNGSKIQLSEFKERTYLNLTLPTLNGKESFRVTGERLN